MIAPVYMHLGRLRRRGRRLSRRSLRLEGESAALRAAYGEALVGAAGGVVTADARAAFDKALAEQPGLPAARFYLGLAAEQDGDKSKAIAIYQSLLGEAPAEAPWAGALKARLAALKGEAAPPHAGERARRRAASGDAQQAMIRGMVERLATRLAQERRRRRANGSALFAPIRCCTNRTRRRTRSPRRARRWRATRRRDAASTRWRANWDSEADR